MKERRSSRVGALLGAALGGLGRCRPEAVTVFAVALTAASIAVLAPGAGAAIRVPAGLTAADWRLTVAVGLDLVAGLAVLAAAKGVGACLVQAQRPRLHLLGTLGLTPRQLAAVAGLQPVVIGTAGVVLGAAAAAPVTGIAGPGAISALGGAALCLLAVVLAAVLTARSATSPGSPPVSGGRPGRHRSLRTWVLPPAVAIGAAMRRDPSLRGLRRLLPLLVGLDALVRELASGGRTASLTWPEWHRALLPPGQPGLVANLLLILVAVGYLCTLFLRTRRQRAVLAVTGAMGATRSQLLVAVVVPSVLSPLAGLLLAALAVAALHLPLPSPAGAVSAAAVVRPSTLIPPAAALAATLAGAIPPAWRGASAPPAEVAEAA